MLCSRNGHATTILTSTDVVTGPVMPLFFFNDTATTEIYTLSLHDALPIWLDHPCAETLLRVVHVETDPDGGRRAPRIVRSEEHTSELQSLAYLVCRLLLEKKNDPSQNNRTPNVTKTRTLPSTEPNYPPETRSTCSVVAMVMRRPF